MATAQIATLPVGALLYDAQAQVHLLLVQTPRKLTSGGVIVNVRLPWVFL